MTGPAPGALRRWHSVARAMRRRSATILQIVTLVIGISVLAVLLWEPHVEGRNAHSTLREIYFRDPFLAYVYVGSIPFFVATYQAFRLLGSVGSRETESSQRAACARLIKNCAGVTIGFVAVGVVILMFIGEERPPAVLLGVLAALPVLLVGASAAAYERMLRSADD
jgi:Protein of unknown function (DUF2975)